MMWMALVALLGGLVLLAAGAELLVRGAVTLAEIARIPPALVGLTIIAFGTSVPELAVCLDAVSRGEPSIALGNVIGSNIVNVMLILGAAALVAPLWVPEELIRFDLPLLAGVSVAVLLCAIDGNVGRLQGAILLFGLFAWGLFELIGAQAGRKIAQRKKHQPFIKLSARSLTIAIGATLLGLGGVLGGAPLVVTGATSIAKALGVSDQVIALTVISLGTALPELATSIAAAFRGQGELAVGNVIGSNLFNLLGVLGASALASPHGVPVTRNALLLDMPVMLFGTLICIPILRSERTVSRAEGGALLLGYVVYVALRFHAAG